MPKHGRPDDDPDLSLDPYEDLDDEAATPPQRERTGRTSPTRSERRAEDARALLEMARADRDSGDGRPPGTDRWSTWDRGQRGPEPRPDWVVTELGAADTELGILKTGKEADVFLLRRAVPGTDRSCLLAAKRYRDREHRLFHRDAAYLEGRRVRRSREMRAMNNRTAFGRHLIAEQWAGSEFAALGHLWSAGAPVPYPVQRIGTELLLEFIGDADGTAAPRLAELRPDAALLRELWRQTLDILGLLAGEGLTHGDLSAYNLLVHTGRLVMIDLPQVVDLVANPKGPAYLDRDVRNISSWYSAHGIDEAAADPAAVVQDLLGVAGLA